MNENVANLLPEQLRPIREDLRRTDGRMTDMETRLSARIDAVDDKLQSVVGGLSGPGGHIRGIDKRVEHIEARLGIEG